MLKITEESSIFLCYQTSVGVLMQVKFELASLKEEMQK